MKVSDIRSGMGTSQVGNKNTELQQGQTVEVLIKHRVSTNKAIVDAGGKEFSAVFEDGVPLEERITARITSRNGIVLQLRTASPSASRQEQIQLSADALVDKAIREAGVKISSEVREAVRKLVEERNSVTSDTVRVIEEVIKKGEGSIQQKIDVLSVMAQKKITVTPKSYEAVFRALYGPSLDKIINQLAKEAPDLVPDPSVQVESPVIKAERSSYVSIQPSDSSVRKLSQQFEILSKALKSEQPINKEALQKLVEQIKGNQEQSQLSQEVQQKVQAVVRQVEQAIANTPKQQTVVSPNSLNRLINKALVDEVVERVKQERNAPPVSRVERVTVEGKAEVQRTRLSEKLETLAQMVKNSQPVSKEQLQQLVQQIKESPELAKVSQEVQRKIQQIVRQVENVLEATSPASRTVSPEKVAQAVPPKVIEQVARQVAQEVDTANRNAGSSMRTEDNVESQTLTQGREQSSSRILQQIEVLQKVLKSEQLINKEALQKLVEQIKGNPEQSQLSRETQQKVQAVVRQVEQAIANTPKQQTVVSPDSLNRFINKALVDETVEQVKQETNAPQVTRAERVQVEGKAEVQRTRLSEKLETLAQMVKNSQPVSKEQLQQLVQQIKESLELAKVSLEVQRNIQQLVRQVEQAIDNTPKHQVAVSNESLSRSIDRRKIDEVVQQLRQQTNTDLISGERRVASENHSASTSVEANKKAPEALNKLAEMVLDIRISGKVTRNQIAALQEMVKQVAGDANVSQALMKDIEALTNKLAKELRMSLSYEAVGRQVEARGIVERSMDTLIQMFKLPAARIAAERTNTIPQESSFLNESGDDHAEPQFLRPVSETFIRLGSVAGLARQELLAALGETQIESFGEGSFDFARSPELIVRDLISSLRGAVLREALPQEETRKMEQIFQQLEETLRLPNQDGERLLAGVDELEQLLTVSGERIAALTAVQSTNFERVTQYIPDYLREVAQEFKQVKKEILNNVDRMSQFLQQKIPQAASYVERIIEPTIEMVNRLVNKGEFALFADMEFEHDVLRISSELQKVKGLLDKGKQDEALQLFQRVRSDLEKLNWQPSYMKVERFFSKTTVDGEMRNPLQLYSQQWREESLTGRSVQEMMRSMGLNYERDALEWLGRREGTGTFSSPHMGSGDFRGQQDSMPHNMKFMLMDGMEHASPRAREMMEQALSNLTGQQLLSKQEPGAPLQSMYVQIPLPWEEGMQSVQMQIQSRTNGEQMDWENCNLFFFLNTPKFGETGISVTVVEREMTIRVQNDTPNVEAAFAPYIPQMERELQQMGYRVNGVTFTPVAKQPEKKEILPTVDIHVARNKAARYTAQEGLDFSV